MSYFNLKVIFTPSEDVGSIESAKLVDDVKDISISLGTELKNNNMKLTVHNNQIDSFSDGTIRHRWVDTDGNPLFSSIKATSGEIIDEDLIDVYAYYTDTDPDTEIESTNFLLFQGIITKGKVQYEEKQTNIRLGTKDRSANILDRIGVPTPFDEQDNWTTPTIVKELLRNSTENNTETTGFNYSGVVDAEGSGWLIDSRLFSEGVKDSGSVTGLTDNDKTITVSGATFVTNNVEKDDWVRNTNTEQYAYVTEILSETQLKLTKPIFSVNDTMQVSNGFIQDIRPDGNNFPKVTFSQLDKPVYEGIDTLAQIENTNTDSETDPDTGNLVVKRAMRYFIDKRNRFHMYIPGDTPELIMELGQTGPIGYDEVQHDINKIEMENSVEGNINFIVFNAGEDMDNDMIRNFSRVPFSGEPNTKECVRHWLHIARGMKQAAFEAGEITKVRSEQFNYPTTYDPLPTGNSYPVWYKGSSSKPTSDIEYNDLFEEEAIRRGKNKCKSIFTLQGQPRWKGTIELRGEPITIGDLIKFTSRPHGIRDILVRVTSASHNINAQTGWTTSINVEEDEVEINKVTGV